MSADRRAVSAEDSVGQDTTTPARVTSPGRNDTRTRVVPAHRGCGVVPRPEGDDPEGKTLILEVFSRTANKWSAIEWLAAQQGIRHERVAAIGNDINDIAMLERAALGIAMGNAIDEAKAAAQRHTLGNDEDGVAFAIQKVLDGEW